MTTDPISAVPKTTGVLLLVIVNLLLVQANALVLKLSIGPRTDINLLRGRVSLQYEPPLSNTTRWVLKLPKVLATTVRLLANVTGGEVVPRVV